jgi:hypothetical protein
MGFSPHSAHCAIPFFFTFSLGLIGTDLSKCLKKGHPAVFSSQGCPFTLLRRLLTQPMAGSKRTRVIEWVERIMPDVVASVWPQDDDSTGPFYLQCPCYAGSVKRRARPGPGALALGAGSATQRLGHAALGHADQVPPPVAGPSPLEATSIDSPRRWSLKGLGLTAGALGGTSPAAVSRTTASATQPRPGPAGRAQLEGQAAADPAPVALPVPAPTRPPGTARTSRAQLFQCLVRDEHSVSQHVKSLRHQACE